jgi:predicted transcriptional regulator
MARNMAGKVRTSVVLSEAEYAALGIVADQSDRSRHYMIRQAVRELAEREGVSIGATPKRKPRKKP